VTGCSAPGKCRKTNHSSYSCAGNAFFGFFSRGTQAEIVVPRFGSDLMDNSPPTKCVLSRMLTSPRPCRLPASCWSKPTPWSFTLSCISSDVARSSALNCRSPLCLTAFCRASCKTRNRQREISSGRLPGIPSWMKSISTCFCSDNSLQKPLTAAARPKYSSFEECKRCDRAWMSLAKLPRS